MRQSEKEEVIGMYLAEIGQRGGLATLERHGAEALSRWGRRGGRARAAKYDSETLRTWARRGGRPRKQKAGV